MADKTIGVDLLEGKGFKPVSQRIEKLTEDLKQGAVANRELQEEFKISIKNYDSYSLNIKAVSEMMVNATAYLVPQMEAISTLNEKILKKESESNALKQKNVQAEIKGVDEKMAALSKLMKYNSEEEDKIQKKYEEGRKANEQRAAKMIQDANGNKERILEIHLELETQLKKIEEIRTNEISEHHKAVCDLVNKTFDNQVSLYEKKKVLINEEAAFQKQNSEIAYNAAIEQQKAIIKQIEALGIETQGLEENIRKKEEAAKTIEGLERMKAENIKAIDEDLKNKLNENTKAQLVETTAMVDKTISELSSRSEKNAKNGLGLIDYKKTKENLQSTQDQLKHFKTVLEGDRDAKILYYASLEKMYANDPVKLKQSQDEKKKVMEQYKTDIEKTEKAITDVSKKENNLRLEQTKEAFTKASEHLKKVTELVEKHFEDVMNGLGESGIIDVNAKKYDEEISKIDAKNAEITKNQEGYAQELSILRYRQADESKKKTDYEMEQLKKIGTS